MVTSMDKHIFSKESNDALLEFLRAAEQQKHSKFCDLEKHKIWKKFVPPIPSDLTIAKTEDIIEIEDSEKGEAEIPQLTPPDLPEAQNLSKNAIEDITYAIKENLETQKQLPDAVLNEILNYPNNKLEVTFKELFDELSLESVINLGFSLVKQQHNETVLIAYLQLLLLQKLKMDYSELGQTLFNAFAEKHTTIFTQELSKMLSQYHDQDHRVLIQYISSLSEEVKALTLRYFLLNCQKLCENHITTIDFLLNQLVDYDSLNKLIQLFTISAEDYAKDKSFGKLLLNTVQYLGKHVLQLEQPLKHIIGSHKSIWKIKIQKKFNQCIEENLILSQSFR